MDFKTRLFLESDIKKHQTIYLSKRHTHFLVNVLRVKPDEKISIFNSQSGEWETKFLELTKKSEAIKDETQVRSPKSEAGPWVAFAPVKKSRTDFIVEKTTELGVELLIPVKTKYTEPKKINRDRLFLIAKEAAEQSGRLSIPQILDLCSLERFLETWPQSRCLFFCDESGAGTPMKDIIERKSANKMNALGFLIGPEGGFSSEELSILNKLIFALGVDLGPRILRSETAAVAVLAAWNALTFEAKY